MASIALTVADTVVDADRQAVLEGLIAYNVAAGGLGQGVPMSIIAHDEHGLFQGGLIGRTGFGTAFVELLFVAETARGAGLGSRLLRAAEDEARRRGMAQIYLDTFSFQAPEFYRRHGYVEFGRLKGFPAGHDRIWLAKALGQP